MHEQRFRIHGDPTVNLRQRPKPPCSIEGCTREATSATGRGWCHTHYELWRRTGSTTPSIVRVVHGLSKTRLYGIWAGMRVRCNNPNHHSYRYYGARGISMCSEWDDFLTFRQWALANGYHDPLPGEHVRDRLSIDRINPDGNYEPANCEWVPMWVNSTRIHTARKATA
jgi:hypothetical protein